MLKFVCLILAQNLLPASLSLAKGQEQDAVLYGKGFAACDDELPTLSVASDNLINTLAEWDKFVASNQFFVVGAADSTCSQCCDSEVLLQELSRSLKDKLLLSYPEKNTKKKKIVRKEIQIARIDLANRDLIEKLASRNVWFPMGTTVQIGIDGRLIKYDGMFANVNMLLHHMQRVATPLYTLTSEEQVMSFLDNSSATIWHEDYSGGLLTKGNSFDENRLMDNFSEAIGFNTRVVAFFFDKAEYQEEIKILKDVATHLSNRYNLRIATVTDNKLIQKMKKSHQELFGDVGMSYLVLKRYDGALFKLNLAEAKAGEYLWWITVHSTKPVDEIGPGTFQLNEAARMPMINIFVDFSTPKVREKCQDLLRLMEDIAPQYERRF